MKSKTGIFLLFSALFILSCDKENSPIMDLNCQNLRNGIINSDDSAVGKEISKLTKDLYPKPTTSDETGHSANINILIERINMCEDIHAELFCYCCIYTYPAQSEILIKVDSKGEEHKLIIDIITPNDRVLEYRTIHETYGKK